MAILKTQGKAETESLKEREGFGMGLRLISNFEFRLKRLRALFISYFWFAFPFFGHSSVLYSWIAAYVTPFFKFHASPIPY
jgi:hypothetical protein